MRSRGHALAVGSRHLRAPCPCAGTTSDSRAILSIPQEPEHLRAGAFPLGLYRIAARFRRAFLPHQHALLPDALANLAGFGSIPAGDAQGEVARDLAAKGAQRDRHRTLAIQAGHLRALLRAVRARFTGGRGAVLGALAPPGGASLPRLPALSRSAGGAAQRWGWGAIPDLVAEPWQAGGIPWRAGFAGRSARFLLAPGDLANHSPQPAEASLVAASLKGAALQLPRGAGRTWVSAYLSLTKRGYCTALARVALARAALS